MSKRSPKHVRSHSCIPCPQPQAGTPLSVSVDLSILDIFPKGNPTTVVLGDWLGPPSLLLAFCQ